MSAEYVHLRLNCLPVVRRDAQGKKKDKLLISNKRTDSSLYFPLRWMTQLISILCWRELDVKSRLNDQVFVLYFVWVLCNAPFLW